MDKRRTRINKEGLIKIILSSSLLIYSIFVAVKAQNYFIFLAMLFSSIGDISIMSSRNCFYKAKESHFTRGITSFAMAHIFYMIAMRTENTAILVALLVLGIILAVPIFTPNEKKAIDIASVFYAVCICLNLMNSIVYSKVAMVGMFCFVVSDIILSTTRNKTFKNPHITETKMQIPVWVTYVTAQILLLTAVLVKN